MASVSYEHVTKRFAGGTLAVNDFNLEIKDTEFMVLVGPSGCGKSTALRMLAGLEEVSEGEIKIGDKVVNDVPPRDRDIAMVFQSYALYPHMTVFDNLAFGLRMRGTARDDIDRRVNAAANILELGPLLKRKPRQLSGGQRQRVALGRAIVREPQAFLLDEPLSNLDAKLRAEMRVELRELQRRLDITSVYVTHDQEEALAISDRVIVMNVGVIEQIGTPQEIYDRPRSRFVADFVGSANIIKGKLAGDGLFATAGGVALKAVAAHKLHGRESEVAIRTAYIDLEARPGENHVPGTVRQRLFHGDFVQYVIDSALGSLSVRRPPTNLVDEGAAVTLSFSPQHCVLLEA